MKNIDIIGGGTISHVRNHLALSVPAYGTTARLIEQLINESKPMNPHMLDYDARLHLTKMANSGRGKLETNEDISNLVDSIIANPDSKIVFFNVALCDYTGHINKGGKEWWDDYPTKSGKYEERLRTSEGDKRMLLRPAAKIISKIRRERKDIFLVGFKTTCGATEDEQFLTGLHLLKTSSCNLVLANDTKTRVNMIITPEQARYAVSTNRVEVIRELVQMAIFRSQGTFTRSTVKPGDAVMWDSELIPSALKEVVDHCIAHGAYKPFNGATVGHFAVKVNETDFVTSKRKVNFNNLNEVGMVLCHSENKDSVIAYGARPSVGGQSQRIIFKDHPETDCIVHFHCPPKPEAKLSVQSQFFYECGSHQCGKNTSDGLRVEVPGIKCVFLDNHGPNIVFHRDIDPKTVIDFIDANFDLSKSTDGVDRSKVVVQ
jgi:hypothetical protein